MLGVTFGDKHSYWDWGLLLKSYPEISAPEPKTKYVDVPGADGKLDLSETLTGFVQYEPRTIKFVFSTKISRSEWPSLCSEIYDYLHGAVRDIIMDDDPEFFYRGRVTIKQREVVKKSIMELTVEATVEPFKTKLHTNEAYRGIYVNGTLNVAVHGSKKPVVPSFKTSAKMQLLLNGMKTYSLPKGESYFPDIVIREGFNSFVFTGEGTVSIEYREGRF